MKDEKESGEAVADEQGSDFLLAVAEGRLMYRNARLIQAEFAAGVGQNHQVVKAGLRFALDLVVLAKFFLEHMLGTFDLRKLFHKGGHFPAGAGQKLVQILVLCV
jgi:hypothetical protein